MVDTLYVYLFTWIAYIFGSGFAVVYLIYSHLKRQPIETIEYLVFVVPPGIWFFLVLSGSLSKSLANLVEPLVLGLIVSVLYLYRTIFGYMVKPPGKLVLTIACVLAVVLYISVPVLPE